MPHKAPHFVQITSLGWNRFDALVAWNGTCARLWTRLARSIDGQAVVVSTAVALAADLGVSAATVRRHLAHLESVRAFRRFRLPGGLTAFAMNPNEVWSGKSTARTRAPYCTGVLGGNAAGDAALRRGAWFLPGIQPTIPAVAPKARKAVAEERPVTNVQHELPFGEGPCVSTVCEAVVDEGAGSSVVEDTLVVEPEVDGAVARHDDGMVCAGSAPLESRSTGDAQKMCAPPDDGVALRREHRGPSVRSKGVMLPSCSKRVGARVLVEVT